jgi:iron-sulfur cluster assembly protein
MKFDDKIESTDTVIELESIKVCINKLSLLYLAGTELDYQDGLNGKGFEWINPNATRTCGCGESFSI